ncbi:50S ribosomal protein L19 [Sporosalibacterium faouarense]|uniref:50S ribosomal protein L19 n=1 Tax=Sporosalibacterium faouarense TaxID=516123 RepID=UPI00141CD34E|nr:50S ribosomal protein L19 [Bacillota bacterium]
MDIIRLIEQEQINKDIPVFHQGDTVQVHYRIKEGNRERVQVFEGTVLKKQGGSSRTTFTVRRISYGVGVERTFPLHSPKIEKIVVTRKGKVRRAKLNYLRDRVGKAARVKEKGRY